MDCRFCKAWNQEDERRCQRCGRRLSAPAPRPAADVYPVMGATAPALEALPGGRTETWASAVTESGAAAAPAPAREARQQPLLFEETLAGPKVIPIPTLAPLHPPVGARRSAPRNTAPRNSRRGSDMQQALDFEAGPLDMQVEAVIYCDAPVALPLHRFIAAAMDASMVLMAVGLFLTVFLLAGGQLVFNKQVIPVFAGAVGLMWALYHSFWCLANGDTPGMKFAGLRVTNFDGRKADRKQRTVRQFAFVLSVLSAGVGLAWAFVDEENLTWHDHISKTFPTPG